MKKRANFECPYDLKSCDKINTLTMNKDCKKCKRHGINNNSSRKR